MARKEIYPDEYRLMLESAPVMIWRSDKSGHYDYFNRAWLEFRGKSYEEESGEGWTAGIHEKDRERRREIFREALSERDNYGMQYQLKRHDGEYRWVYEQGIPYGDDAGNFSGFVGSCLDISERVELEKELQEAHITELKKLRGLLPICANCKNIRNDDGYWQSVETYVMEHSSADFTHSLCPECRDKLYPNMPHRKNRNC